MRETYEKEARRFATQLCELEHELGIDFPVPARWKEKHRKWFTEARQKLLELAFASGRTEAEHKDLLEKLVKEEKSAPNGA